MTLYVTYQCSTCRRNKDIAQDNLRALPTQCTITKGCSGSLYKVGDSLLPVQAPPVTNLTDWYPRGQNLSPTPEPEATQYYKLSNSSTGAVTLALLLSDVDGAAIQGVRLQMKQRLTADVPSTGYSFVQQAQDVTNTVISGKDSNGKILRFDQAAIDADRVRVTVNGVIRTDLSLAPNVITFESILAIGSQTIVTVFSAIPTTLVNLTLLKHSASTLGAWNNIRWAQEYGANTRKWWFFTANTVSGISTEAQYQLDSIYNSVTDAPLAYGWDSVRFVLSTPPHDNVDRSLNLYVSGVPLSEEFVLRSTFATFVELLVASDLVSDIVPPLQLIGGPGDLTQSYVSVDTFPTDTSASSETQFPSARIIGPV